MHEMSLITEAYRVCRAEVDARGGGVITRARLAVGELSAVEPDLMRFAWEALTAGGADAGAVLEIDWHRAQQICPACGPVDDRQAGSWLRLCEACGQPLSVEGGRELDILDLSFEPTDVEAGP